MAPDAPTIEIEDSAEGLYEFMDLHDCGDGLPGVPPTPDRVRAMVAASGRYPEELIGVLKPRNGLATVEAIARNAVMAGCRAEYFPVVLAAVESVLAGNERQGHASTTNCNTNLLVVNGPIRHEIGVNYQEGCFGVAGRANATIGRAVQLCWTNIGAALPGDGSKSVFGQPGRYTMCIGEWDEQNPWGTPLHVQRGFEASDSCVTAISATGTINITDIWCRSGESYLTTIAQTINTVSGAWMILGDAEITIVLNPSWAGFVADDGFSLEDVRTYLWEHSQLPLDRFPPEHAEPLRNGDRVLPNGRVPQTETPDRFNILVAGGRGGLHAIGIHGMGHGDMSLPASVTKPIGLPA